MTLSAEIFSELELIVMFDVVLILPRSNRLTPKLLELAPLTPFRMIAPPPDETCKLAVEASI